MIEITNKTKCPVQLIVRSKTHPRSLTTLNIPAIGKGKNIFYLEDERTTEYIDRLVKSKLISTRYISDKEIGRK